MRPSRRPAEEPHPPRVADDSALYEAMMDVWPGDRASAAGYFGLVRPPGFQRICVYCDIGLCFRPAPDPPPLVTFGRWLLHFDSRPSEGFSLVHGPFEVPGRAMRLMRVKSRARLPS